MTPTPSLPPKKEYSPEQRAIVGHTSGHLQVIACAGSGKTETVAARVATLIEVGVEPASIVTFTFTRAAASGLKARILTRYQERNPGSNLDLLSPLYVGTIHAYCLRLLQLHVPRYATFSLYDEHRLVGLVLREYFDLGLDKLGIKNLTECTQQFLRSVGVVENEMIPAEALPPGAFRDCYVKLLDTLDRYHVLTHNQCIAKAVEALDYPAVYARVHGPLSHLIVDEFQDINPAQARLIERLGTGETTVCVVGDDDQAIYQWRGSSVGYIQRFKEKFDATTFSLSTNRRSARNVVEAADAFAQTIAPRLAKSMSAMRDPIPAAVRCYGSGNASEEAEAVADAIATLHAQGVEYRAMAILLRTARGRGGGGPSRWRRSSTTCRDW